MARVDLFLLLALVTQTWALYSSGDAVVDLTPANFDKQVSFFKSSWFQGCMFLLTRKKRFFKFLVKSLNKDIKENLFQVQCFIFFSASKIVGISYKYTLLVGFSKLVSKILFPIFNSYIQRYLLIQPSHIQRYILMNSLIHRDTFSSNPLIYRDIFSSNPLIYRDIFS